MLLSSRRLAAAVLMLVLAAGGSGLCAGWAATPEARMACCTDDGSCPMHKSSGDDTQILVSQAVADGCCGTSERDDSTPSATAFVPVVALAPLGGAFSSVVAPAGHRFDALRALVPLPGSPVPKHLLLSVFLI